jgi:hypothetical protein
LFIDFLIFRKSKVKGKKMTGPILDEISVKNQRALLTFIKKSSLKRI